MVGVLVPSLERFCYWGLYKIPFPAVEIMNKCKQCMNWMQSITSLYPKNCGLMIGVCPEGKGKTLMLKIVLYHQENRKGSNQKRPVKQGQCFFHLLEENYEKWERREENCEAVNNHQKKNVLAKIIGSELMNYKLKKLSVVLEKKKNCISSHAAFTLILLHYYKKM